MSARGSAGRAARAGVAAAALATRERSGAGWALPGRVRAAATRFRSAGYRSPPSRVINSWADRNAWVSDCNTAQVCVVQLQ
jgi:hypothetical protein